MVDTSSYSERQAACDADVAATKQHDTKKQPTTSGSALEHSVEKAERKGPVQSIDSETETNKQMLLRCEAEQQKDRVEQETGNTGGVEETRDEHVIPAAAAALDHDATEAGLELPSRSSEDNNAAISETHSDAADVVSRREHLPTADDQCEDREDREDREDSDLKDKEPVRAQSQEPEEQKADTEVQEYLSSGVKQKDELEKEMVCSETAIDGTVIDAANWERREDSDKPVAAETESKLEEESESLGVSNDVKMQTECPCSEALKSKVRDSKDDEILDSDIVDNEQCPIEKTMSSAAHRKYLAAVKKAKVRLKKTSEKEVADDSVLSSLRFYTREEHLDEYFCHSCNEGSVLCFVCFAFLVTMWGRP